MLHTKKLALSGIFAGLALALMWLISFFPSMDYALPALAGLLSVPLLLEFGTGWALGAYAVAGMLSFLLLPNKIVPLLYVAFLGYYPILKVALARRLPRWAEFLVLLLVFNASVTGCLFLGARLFGLPLEEELFSGMPAFLAQYALPVLFGMGNLGFISYNYATRNMLRVYEKKWRKKLQRVLRGN
ncbi:MAG: hypothetical protein LBC83_02605 [Oscillospiraceae bacterium]|jgi:hypothetical protein|nr:hypothetical protein [Oscillospiraceae bacterium]